MNTDLIIVGGGPAGCALALAVAGTKRRVTLVDARDAPHAYDRHAANANDPRAYAISPAAAAFLDDIGVWRHLDPRACAPVTAMDITGDRGARLRFTAYQARCEALAWIVEAASLENELRETARRQSHITVLAPASPSSLNVSADNAKLILADGTCVHAPLVIGADGRDSWLRDAVGLATHSHDYEERGVVVCFACEKPHADTARQWFLGDSVLAWLPLPDQRISIVWSAPEPLASDLLAATPESLALRVAAAGDHTLGCLKALTPARAFPLRMTRVTNPIAHRVALLGDAAHGIHPLSGHGINLGFLDARDMAKALGDCRAFEDIGALRVLQRYRRARTEETLVMQQATHGLHGLFASKAPGLGLMRNLGLTLADRLPLLKSNLARYAMGGR